MYIFYGGDVSSCICLKGDGFMHLKARRRRVGDVIRLFDGKGGVWEASVDKVERAQAYLTVGDKIPQQMVDRPRLVLGVTKLPTVEIILQKAVEIGVGEILLVNADNTPIAFDEKIFAKKKPRWEKIIVGACEQSENLFVPQLGFMSFAQYVSGHMHDAVIFHPEASNTYRHTDKLCGDLMIGPEGGWSHEEVNCGARALNLGEGILRADTACMAVLLLSRLS